MIESAGLSYAVLKALYDLPPARRRQPGIHWAAGPEWKKDVMLLQGPNGEYLAHEGPGGDDVCPECGSLNGSIALIGLPIKFRKDGGVPHLVQD